MGQLAERPLLKVGHQEVVPWAEVPELVVRTAHQGVAMAACWHERPLPRALRFGDANS